ncbi:unnamed protein product [Musa banksii]
MAIANIIAIAFIVIQMGCDNLFSFGSDNRSNGPPPALARYASAPGELNVVAEGTPLVRRSSAPAGFFSHLLMDHPFHRFRCVWFGELYCGVGVRLHLQDEVKASVPGRIRSKKVW